MALENEERRTLLQIARRVVEDSARGMDTVSPELYRDALRHPALSETCGVFVTLRREGRLRGCIGYVEGFVPLARGVAETAQSAALRDPRFPPVREDEVEGLSIEISVLSPLRPMTDPSEIQIGVHGLVVAREGRRGLLLPQVATDHGFTTEVFLEETCRKAGLPRDAWKDGEVSLFSAEVFGEGELRK